MFSLFLLKKVTFYFTARFYPLLFKVHKKVFQSAPILTAQSVTQHRALQVVTSHSIRLHTSLHLIDFSNREFRIPVAQAVVPPFACFSTPGIWRPFFARGFLLCHAQRTKRWRDYSQSRSPKNQSPVSRYVTLANPTSQPHRNTTFSRKKWIYLTSN